jgi:hypothetical protein
VKAFISRRAELAAERIDARWRKDADHPDVFVREYLAAIDHMESVANPGTPFPTEKRPHLRRLLLSKSHSHIYFDIDERKQMIRILHVWDARRARPPKL